MGQLGPLAMHKIRVAPPTRQGTRCKYCRRYAKTMTQVYGPLVNFHIPTCGCCYPRLTIEFICQKVKGISTIAGVKVGLEPVDVVGNPLRARFEVLGIHTLPQTSSQVSTAFPAGKPHTGKRLLSFPPKT